MNYILNVLLVFLFVLQYIGVSGRHHENGIKWKRNHQRRDLHIGPRGGHNNNLDHQAMTVEMQNNTEVISQVGGTATLRCYTHFVADAMVTWLRKDEDHILTAGGEVYSSEARYSVAHVRHQKLYELSIREVRQSDGGLYECQIATHPPTSLFFTLKVVEARAVIQGAPEVHVHTGNRLRLHCTVEHATEPPVYIFWFHNNSMVNYESKRPLKVIQHHFGSSLTFTNVTWDDAGAYRCEPDKAQSANVTLHVVADEKQAALYKGEREDGEDRSPSSRLDANSLLMCLILFVYHSLT